MSRRCGQVLERCWGVGVGVGGCWDGDEVGGLEGREGFGGVDGKMLVAHCHHVTSMNASAHDITA